MTGSATAGNDAALVGREEELAKLRELVAAPHAESRALLLLGESGMGKTLLITRAVQAARAAGMRVLAAAGRESEQDLAFAGLHQLLRPVLGRLSYLPPARLMLCGGYSRFRGLPRPLMLCWLGWPCSPCCPWCPVKSHC